MPEHAAIPPLLGPGDAKPVSVSRSGAGSPCLIVCDHAGRAVPVALGRLGLTDVDFDAHIAYDIGAAGLSERLGVALGACVIRQTYSRLVIDCNRAPGRPDSIVAVSDGVAIPGNRDLSKAAIAERVAMIHRPYHDAIAAELAARDAMGLGTILVCQHSFTPSMGGFERPWHVGVLHLGDSPASLAMLRLLRDEGDLVVGDNEPYAMDAIDYTAPCHARGPGRDMLELEVRQDLIADAPGQALWARRLARLLQEVFEQTGGSTNAG
jgi:predicted N-formylglutamate amidohydrolase